MLDLIDSSNDDDFMLSALACLDDTLRKDFVDKIIIKDIEVAKGSIKKKF